jgi:hypothetical protein
VAAVERRLMDARFDSNAVSVTLLAHTARVQCLCSLASVRPNGDEPTRGMPMIGVRPGNGFPGLARRKAVFWQSTRCAKPFDPTQTGSGAFVVLEHAPKRPVESVERLRPVFP